MRNETFVSSRGRAASKRFSILIEGSLEEDTLYAKDRSRDLPLATDRTTTLRSSPKSADNPPKAALVQHESANVGSTSKRYKPINDRHLAALFDLFAKGRLQQLL